MLEYNRISSDFDTSGFIDGNCTFGNIGSVGSVVQKSSSCAGNSDNTDSDAINVDQAVKLKCEMPILVRHDGKTVWSNMDGSAKRIIVNVKSSDKDKSYCGCERSMKSYSSFAPFTCSYKPLNGTTTPNKEDGVNLGSAAEFADDPTWLLYLGIGFLVAGAIVLACCIGGFGYACCQIVKHSGSRESTSNYMESSSELDRQDYKNERFEDLNSGEEVPESTKDPAPIPELTKDPAPPPKSKADEEIAIQIAKEKC